MKLARFNWKGTISWGIVESGMIYKLIGDVYEDFIKGDLLCPLGEISLLPPAEPSIMVCGGLNFHKKLKDEGLPVLQEPPLFFKPISTLIGPNDSIVYPWQTHQLHSEGELCMVIKRKARDITESEAKDYILGYTCGNDITCMDFLFTGGKYNPTFWNYSRAKCFDTFGPLGPTLVTELDWHELGIKDRVNGVTTAEANMNDVIFGPEKLVSYISEFMTLIPGDVVWTGNPTRNFELKVGDTVEVEIEGIGILKNTVVAHNKLAT
jgi:2-keto-4-pentenoate hydratase/2-oxohepta-3-ene-1,7-dioic acid hydratase in catechol pathway